MGAQEVKPPSRVNGSRRLPAGNPPARLLVDAARTLLLVLLPCLGQALRAADAFEGFAFNPPADPFRESAIDLRFLNENFAGEHGFITTRGDEFARSPSREPVRFWAVNGPPGELQGDALRACARRLAKYGVNLVRMHGPMFDQAGEADLKKASRAREVVAALKAEGIYSHFSIYFPLWMTPGAEHPWLKGYDGRKHPFAALMFNPAFQDRYRSWWRALLLTPGPDGRKLIDEPAVFGLEIQNEDSFFFWTFNPEQIPAPQMELLESQFGEWLKGKHGSIEAALGKWKGQKLKRDDAAAGRAAFRPLWNVFNEKSARDRETAEFLFATQRKFYVDTIAFLRSLGFKGLITPSNWATASPEVFGPLEKWTYEAGNFIDRHGYFSVTHKGDNAEWSIRNGHAYSDRSALRFDATSPGKPKQFVHPAMEIAYAGKPSMISETTWNRPNRYRSEAPLYYACYGALQDTGAIVHFALDGANWSVKPGFWMQPWTLMAPSQAAQFPAAALIYRRGLVKVGDLLASVRLNTNDLLNLKGTPLPQDASFDELRMKDVPQGTEVKPGQRIDPLIHYAGRTAVTFTGEPGKTTMQDLKPLIDRGAQTVRSSTRELALDYGKGLLTINAPGAQGASGNLKAGGAISLSDISVTSDLDNAHIIVVSLDGEPIARSRRMLVQAMSEEQPSGFAAEPAENGLRRITNIGRDPWLVKSLQGTVTFIKGPSVEIQPLDFNGYPAGPSSRGVELALRTNTVYYLLTRAP
ncbi:MAG: hypothetical protein HYR88_08570 [Verrucomicrobia bacterium]|nr:hypothetical protein [Verrucomicrobiota bacterium]MBI3868188.1 hypothetical protein [Verrucomicrobiota bacterium]